VLDTFMNVDGGLCRLEMGKNPNPAKTNRTRNQVLPRAEPNRTEPECHGSYQWCGLRPSRS